MSVHGKSGIEACGIILHITNVFGECIVCRITVTVQRGRCGRSPFWQQKKSFVEIKLKFEFAIDNGFIQVVNFPTRKKNLLDIVLVDELVRYVGA